MSRKDVLFLGGITKHFADQRKNGRTALVFASELGFGLGRMFDSMLEFDVSIVSYMVFLDYDTAMKWLLSEN